MCLSTRGLAKSLGLAHLAPRGVMTMSSEEPEDINEGINILSLGEFLQLFSLPGTLADLAQMGAVFGGSRRSSSWTGS